MGIEEGLTKAVKEIRENESKLKEKRKFDQTVDLIVNLKNFDVKREGFNTFVQLPHKLKDKKVAGFFEKDNKLVDVIKKEEFVKYKEKREIKKLVQKYDNFIANAKLMPAVATAFGRVLGPVGKMPSPQLGIVPVEEDKLIEVVLGKINSAVRVMVKEPSIKVGVAKESLKDEQIVENILTAYNKIVENLPKKEENIRNVKIKFTMGGPVGVGG
ncbi:MAG: hypothetical protein ABIJ58_01025 [Nanoarchaeota archaeon]